MSYAHTLTHGLSYYGLKTERLSLYGLGVTPADSANARRLNEEQNVVSLRVGPGYLDGWLDAALTVQGVPSSDAGRVPNVVKEVLESSGARVDQAVWGGGSGLESIRGKVYVRWKPGNPYNAVTYADVARRLFMSAADQFPAGARLIMHRYRIPGGTLRSLLGGPGADRYVYPEGGAIPASAPEAAHRTTAADVPLDPGDISGEAERLLAQDAGVDTGVITGLAVAGGAVGVVAIGATAYLIYRARMKKNSARRRRRRTSRRGR